MSSPYIFIGRVQDGRYADLSYDVRLTTGGTAVELIASQTVPRIPLVQEVPLEPVYLSGIHADPSRVLTEPVLAGHTRISEAGDLDFRFPAVETQQPEDHFEVPRGYPETLFEQYDSPSPRQVS